MCSYDDLIKPIYNKLEKMYSHLHEQINKLDRYKCDGKEFLCVNQNAPKIPDDKGGIYIMFEEGEKYKNFDRIVRVGKAEDSLYKRLKQHFINLDKDHSILRKHIGKAQLLGDQKLLEEWKTKGIKNLSQEKVVTKHLIENISFCIIPLSDKEQIRKLEQTLIEILSIHNRLYHETTDNDIQTKKWLGNDCKENQRVMQSGMWNCEHVRIWKK